MSRLKLSGPAILIAVLVCWPALRETFVDHTLAVPTMLIRVGIAVFFAMAAVAVISSVVDTYRLQNLRRERIAADAERRDDHRSGT